MRADLPAGLGAAGEGGGAGTQDKGRHLRGSRRQRQTAAGGEIEHWLLAPQIDQDRTQRSAAQPFGAGAQRAKPVTDAHVHHIAQRQAEFAEAGRVDAACLVIEKILPDPQKRTPLCNLVSEAKSKARCSGKVGTGSRKDLVQRAAHQAPAQRRIETCNSQRSIGGSVGAEGCLCRARPGLQPLSGPCPDMCPLSVPCRFATGLDSFDAFFQVHDIQWKFYIVPVMFLSNIVPVPESSWSGEKDYGQAMRPDYPACSSFR